MTGRDLRKQAEEGLQAGLFHRQTFNYHHILALLFIPILSLASLEL